MIRFVVLALCSGLMVGNFFAYDLRCSFVSPRRHPLSSQLCTTVEKPASLNKPLQDYLDIPDEPYQYQLNLFYSVYSLPNIILPFFGGWLVDRFGTRKLMTILSTFVCAGQFIFSLGMQQKLLRRVAVGCGVNLSVARLGSVLNDILSPRLALKFDVPVAVWFGFATCAFSMACGAAVNLLDSYHDRRARTAVSTSHASDGEEDEEEEGTIRSPLTAGAHPHPAGKLDLAAAMTFPLPFWQVCLIMCLMYATVVPFNAIHSAFLQTKWYKGDPQTASEIMGIPDVISALTVPFAGSAADIFGHRSKMLMLCGLMMAGVHLYLGIADEKTSSSPIPALSILGFSYAFLLTFWACIPIIVDERHQAAAFGIATGTLNASLTLFPLVVAALVNADPTYYLTEMFFVICSLLGVAAAFWLWRTDAARGGLLERPEAAVAAPRGHGGEYMELEGETVSTGIRFMSRQGSVERRRVSEGAEELEMDDKNVLA
ncbi:major facilitator superfamily domain-containing protein [Blyttiomyces helicus]|uniref:Lysosomal dipeptide transporter MFSD1 n=1 Tax=Blyttiomyces helicus TaxID=388810 RepID=A0A4P9WJZ9_9FUNG|nr:major facilitator superfamily domain-containing protein [Blyttiomyces helicus]|eukprot:RKO93289.1 major facilitator superfamily domain-containing protein [Blyttiomyces helicus]